MDELTQKYENFVNFLDEIINEDNNEYIKNLKNLEAYTFILGLKIRIKELELDKYNDEDKIIDESFKKIIEKTNFDMEKFKDEHINKFKRYLSYFYNIVALI